MNTAYIFLAEGFETVEALGTADVLRRGGVETVLVATGDEPFVTSSQRVTVGIDMMLGEVLYGTVDDTDVMVFPGGMPGTKNLAANKPLMKLMVEHYKAGGKVACICAAPGLVGGQLPGLDDKIFTCFDGFEDTPQAKGAVFVPKPAITSGNLITGRSAGYYIDFGLEILASLKDAGTVEKVRLSMLLDVAE